jgi:hypothetical protein
MTAELVNKVIDYIRQSHMDAGEYILDDIQFDVTGSGKEQIGYTRAVYTGSDWTITIGHAVVPGALYEIRAVYGDDGIIWTGTSDGTTITEVSYIKAR